MELKSCKDIGLVSVFEIVAANKYRCDHCTDAVFLQTNLGDESRRLNCALRIVCKLKSWFASVLATVQCRSFFVAIAGLIIFANSVAYAESKPQRIVSTHLCTDQLLMLIADPNNLVSLSHFATNPEMSMMVDRAASFPVNHGLAEELVLLNPDLILTSQFGSPNVLILKKLGYRIVSVPVAQSLNDIRSNIRLIAAEIDEQQRGEDLIARFDRDIQVAEFVDSNDRPTILVYEANGYTIGRNTLRSEIIEKAGFVNLASKLGVSGNRRLPLETLVGQSLDAWMVSSRFKHAALAHELPNHPALKNKFASVPRVEVQGKIWICGTPFVAQALAQLSEFHRELIEQAK